MIHRILFAGMAMLWLTGQSYAQKATSQTVETQRQVIERLFDSLIVHGVDISQTLMYTFPFYDAQKSKVEHLSHELDSEEFHISIAQKFQKLYQLDVSQSARHTPQSLFELDIRLRKLGAKRNLDAFGPWVISSAVPEKDLVSNEEFEQYIASLSDQKLFETAHHLYGFKSYKQAEIAFGQCVARNVKADTAWYMMGLIFLDQDKYRKGIEHLKQALKVNSRHEEAIRRLGIVYLENHYYQESIPYLTLASEMRPQDDEILNKLALAQFHLEWFNQSYENNRKALKLNRKNAAAKYLKAQFKNEHIRKMRKRYPTK